MVAIVSVGVVALGSALRHLRKTRGAATASLQELWVGGIETMLGVPGAGTLSLAPCNSAAESAASFPEGVPEALAKHTTFALTAFDPPGVSRTREENAKENGRLWARLQKLQTAGAWKAFGVDVDEGWREDGFAIAFADATAGRLKVSSIARDFQQGAIYEYYVANGALYRRTRGVTMKMDETTAMRQVDHEELKRRSPLVSLPWAGPEGF